MTPEEKEREEFANRCTHIAIYNLDPIYATYRRYQHLDRFVTDPSLCGKDKGQHEMLAACWQAIKDELKKRNCEII